jgi:hypothetical protein
MRFRDTTATLFNVFPQIDKELRIQSLDKNFDLAVATEAPPHVEGNELRFPSFDYGACQHRDFFFQTSATERSDRASILPNEHARTGAPIS